MATISNQMKHLTLMRLKALYPDLFYPQDWYESEEFAHEPIYRGKVVDVKTAADWCLFIIQYMEGNDSVTSVKMENLLSSYVWTTSVDGEGNKVYVGGVNRGHKFGIQIHRHLANPPVHTPEELSL